MNESMDVFLHDLMSASGKRKMWGNVGYGYLLENGYHIISVSTHGRYPTQIIIDPVVSALRDAGFLEIRACRVKASSADSVWRTTRISFPIGSQLPMFDMVSNNAIEARQE